MEKKSKQAKGGDARAAKLTKEERSEIARKAAAARWRSDEPVTATHEGIIDLGGLELACANLPDERRVVNEATMLTALDRGYSGYYSQRDAANPEATVLPRYLAPKALKPFISGDLDHLQLIPYTTPTSGTVAKGLNAELIPEICEVWLKASRSLKKPPRSRIGVYEGPSKSTTGGSSGFCGCWRDGRP